MIIWLPADKEYEDHGDDDANDDTDSWWSGIKEGLPADAWYDDHRDDNADDDADSWWC